MSYDSEVLADAPLAYWKLSEASGPFADSASAGAYPIASVSGTGGAVSVVSPIGNALNFATGAYLQTAFSFSAAPAVTLECLARTTTTNAWFSHCRSGATPGIALALNQGVAQPGAGKLVGAWNANNLWVGRQATAASIADGNWHHIAVVWLGSGVAASQFLLYVDGVRVDNASDVYGSTSATTLTSAALRIANSDTSNAGGSAIGNFAAYSTALSAQRIQAHYAAVGKLSGVWSMV